MHSDRNDSGEWRVVVSSISGGAPIFVVIVG